MGQIVGDLASEVGGLVEGMAGISAEGVGIGLDGTGIGAIAGIPLHIAGAAVIGHAASVLYNGASNLGEDASHLVQSIKSGSSEGAGNAIKSGSLDSLPINVQTMYNKYESDGWKGSVSGQTQGTAAGSKYSNRDGKLPTTDGAGNPVTYKEFDVNNKIPNQNRDVQRFVKGRDGSVYYTDDHYVSFTKIE